MTWSSNLLDYVIFSKFSEQELRVYVFQAIIRSVYFLDGTVSIIKQETEKP